MCSGASSHGADRPPADTAMPSVRPVPGFAEQLRARWPHRRPRGIVIHADEIARYGPRAAHQAVDRTVAEVVLEGERRLHAAEVDQARMQAELLLAHAMGATRAQVHLRWLDRLGPTTTAAFRALVDERAEGIPLQYVLGVAGFRDLELEVDGRTLIPRPETEGLVELALERHRRGDVPPGPWVDVGTGSGAIALSVAREAPDIPVIAVDVSSEALSVARRNRKRVTARQGSCYLVLGSLLAAFRPSSVAAVVSNPPYVATRDLVKLPREIVDHEPRLGLDGGVSGLKTAHRLAIQAAVVLRPGGMLAMELGDGQPGLLADSMRRAAWAGRISVHSDLAGRPRYLMVTKEA